MDAFTDSKAGPTMGVGTKVPRWTQPGLAAQEGFGAITASTSMMTRTQIEDLACRCGVGLPEVLRAVALVVIRSVSGDPDLVVGVPGGSLRVRVVGSWAEVVSVTADSAIGPVLDAEILLDDCVDQIDHNASSAVLVISPRITAAEVTWVVRHRRDTIDSAYAARLGGYLVQALECAGADGDALHDSRSLLSEPEVLQHVHGLAGAWEPIGETMFPDLFAQRVHEHPDRTAVSHGTRTWSYRELDEHSRRIAAELGRLPHEGVVGVVLDRGLDWAAATLAVLRAGGVYLPIRPEFPTERIRAQLAKARATAVIATSADGGNLDLALASLQDSPRVVLVDRPVVGSTTGFEPTPRVSPDQLAYVYFTSGSTGSPKGAMCEHGTMLNHLWAKVDDLGLGPGVAVAQTASQSFDISLWQLIGPLLTGGEVRIVDTHVLLDVSEFLDELAEHRIQVIQLVPSYFEVFLGELERRPRDLGRLRMLSITGEALRMDLVRRWFAIHPGVTLVNAYGATEVGDDTMHEVLTGVPARDFVSVGRSLRNVHTYVVDEGLRLVPLGSPGEIVFSGVSVGRGYLNDETRSRAAFVDDPHRPGNRLYRTGDFGRWLPEGRIEYLGRRDEQVKMRGYRVEIGEVESKLMVLPGVVDGAVVVVGDGENRSLVGFYTGPEELSENVVRQGLAATLPDYMVPSTCHRLDALPLSENGKVDRQTLRRLVATLQSAGVGYAALRTSTERLLATAWAEVLNLPVDRIGADDRFYQLGGTSLAAVRLIVRLDRRLSLRDIAEDPTLRELADVLDDDGECRHREDAMLLHRLGTTRGGEITLVCFPYAGGNAVNFQALAEYLDGHDITVFGVELPGHDLGHPGEKFADVGEVATALGAEIAAHCPGPIAFWGHGTGSAYAFETARLLEADGVPVSAVFLGAAGLDESILRADIAEVSSRSNLEITTSLRDNSSYVELDDLKHERAELVGSAYRHDVVCAGSYLLEMVTASSAYRIEAVLHIIDAADDPQGGRSARSNWTALASRVEQHTVDRGGPHFVRTVPEVVAHYVANVLTAAATAGSVA